MQRQEGRGAFRAMLDHTGFGQPMRLLLEYHWPPSEVHVTERFDEASEAVFESLEGQWQRVMAEVRVRAQCDAHGGAALKYLTNELPWWTAAAADTIGQPVSFIRIGMDVTPTSQTSDELADPAREVTVELLREDPRAVYLEMVSKWTQVPIGAPAIQLETIRPIGTKPSAYVDEARTSLQKWVSAIADTGRTSK